MNFAFLYLFFLSFFFRCCADVGEVGEYLLGVLSLAGARLTAVNNIRLFICKVYIIEEKVRVNLYIDIHVPMLTAIYFS